MSASVLLGGHAPSRGALGKGAPGERCWGRASDRHSRAGAKSTAAGAPTKPLGVGTISPPARPAVALDPRSTQPTVPPLPVEPVEDRPRLILVAAGGSFSSNADDVTAAIDELLRGRDAGRTHGRMERGYRSMIAAFEPQATPERISKATVSSAVTIAAQGLEAAWLKEQIYR